MFNNYLLIIENNKTQLATTEINFEMNVLFLAVGARRYLEVVYK